MELKICSIEVNGTTARVIVEGNSQEDVMSPAARRLVVTEATKNGLSRCGTSGNEVAYPVDENGETSDDLLLGRSEKPMVGFRCEYNVTAGI